MRKGRYRFDCSSIQAILPKKMVIREKARIRRKLNVSLFITFIFFGNHIVNRPLQAVSMSADNVRG